MIVCVLLPRFQLAVAAAAAGTARDALLQKPVALAPEPGGSQVVGEVSLAAEAFGVHPGMRLGEALARCPRLTLLPGDPAGVADSWERLLVRLESIGAAVEPERPGLVCFDGRGLLQLHGGIEGVLAASRRALRVSARLTGAPEPALSSPLCPLRCCAPARRWPIFRKRSSALASGPWASSLPFHPPQSPTALGLWGCMPSNWPAVVTER
ncbi:MAG: hypothetical protein E6G05_00400 [Actinobacteria bacterium]|nr:MAG: hypothetical protein E6G05_00400 [Actinomycetota bacterium]